MLHKLGIIVIIKNMDPLFLRKLRIERQIPTRMVQQELQQPPPEQDGKAQQTQGDLPQQAQAANAKNVQSKEQVNSAKQPTNISSQSERIMQDMRSEMLSPRQLKMNYLASIERSSYVKKMMNLPETLPELLVRLQNPDLARDVRNIVLQPIPEPDTQRSEKKDDNDSSKPRSQNQSEGDDNKTYQRPNDGFKDVLKAENDRNQAIMRHYNVNTERIISQDNESQIVQNGVSSNNLLKGQVEVHEDIVQNTDNLGQKPAQQPTSQTPVENKPVIPQQPQPQIVDQTPQPEVKPNVPQQPTPQAPVENKPVIPQQPQPQIVDQTPQPVIKPNPDNHIEGRISIDDRGNRGEDKVKPPIDNRHGIRNNERPPIEFRPIDSRIIQDINNQIIDPRIMPDNRLDPRFHRPEPRHLIPNEPKEPKIGEPKSIETKQAEAAANLYANLAMNEMNNPTLTQMRQRLSDDAIELLFTGLINLNDLAKTIKHGGHDARSKLILAMASASRQGIDNSQISSTMKQISESMTASENNPSSILKNIIMLYLPWYPLQEGVGFNISIETMPGVGDFSSLLKVYIQTRNYGNVNGSLVLLTGNIVDMDIQCNDIFPKDDLLEKMKDVTDNHSMQSNISIHDLAQMEHEINNQEASVNLSSTYELNPFLLLMAHSFIKNTILIDSTPAVKQPTVSDSEK